MRAAVARMALNGLIPQNPVLFDVIWLSPIWLAMLHDWHRERRVHPVYGWSLLALAPVPMRLLLVESGPWRGFTDWLAGIVAA